MPSLGTLVPMQEKTLRDLNDEERNDLIGELSKTLVASVKEMQEQLERQFAPVVKAANESSRITNEYAQLLSAHGWYISANIKYDSVFQIFLALKNNNKELVEKMISEYYRQNLSGIKAVLLERWPNRKQILLESFKAHDLKMYSASTILFLSQVDGICDGNIFRSKKKLKKYLEQQSSPEIIDSVLMNESAIDVDTRKEDKSNFFSDLNRHGVMHGFHLEYGTENNSLKALSMLCFISDFLNRYKK
jgi:hypothetical protein